MQSCFRGSIRFLLAVLILGFAAPMLADGGAMLSGTITDSLGAVIQNAKVELLSVGPGKPTTGSSGAPDSGEIVQTTNTDAAGRYSFAIAAPGRFRVCAQAATFQDAASEQRYVGEQAAQIDLALSPSVVAQEIVVTAAGVPMPELQTGASIGVIDGLELATRRDVEEELRLQPGAQITRTGQPGAQASLYVRGGPYDATKVLIDGIPANDIGGAMNFANLNAAGFEKAELYRGPNSALFGSDAEAGVLVLTTRRGATPLPELNYAAGGGTFGTLHQESSMGGAWRRFDYFADLGRFDTQNGTPNSRYHNAAAVANFGWQLPGATELRVAGRRAVSAFNSPNAIDLYGIPDNAASREQYTTFGATLENRANPRWHNLVRYAGLRLRSQFQNFGPTGIPATDPFGFPIFLGRVTTIRGANGYEVTGQGILQFSPFPFESSLLSDRDSVYAQTDYRFNSHVGALFGFRYEAEGGYQNFGFAKPTVSRGNYSYTMQFNGGFGNRLFYTVGSGVDNNAVFGFAATPRASLAYHLIRPNDHGIFSGTRLHFNFGKGIKEPSIYHETNSLYELLQTIPNGGQIISQFHVHPFRAVQSRSYDGGVQQMLWGGRARLSFTYFHNEFGDQAEFVPTFGLASLGVAPEVISELQTNFIFGAIVNSLAYRAQGVELEAEYRIARGLSVRGGWTWTDAEVQRSFSSDALFPSFNPNCGPDPACASIPIGAFSPLVGARPFHIAPQAGYFAVDWSRGRYQLRATGTLVSRRDDSTFLSDPSYGPTLLLPNRNLDPGYQRIDLFGSVRIHPRMSLYTTMENLLNQRYYESFGYPALPFTVRSGVQIRLGGESWKL